MNPTFRTIAARWTRFIIGVTGLSGAVYGLSGCAVEAGPGYGYGGYGGSVGVDYYEPYGVAYGGWDPGYYVGPYRGHGDWHGGADRGGPPRSFRGAPGGHAPPGIPSGPRGGGFAGHGGGAAPGGGGRGGGGGGHH